MQYIIISFTVESLWLMHRVNELLTLVFGYVDTDGQKLEADVDPLNTSIGSIFLGFGSDAAFEEEETAAADPVAESGQTLSDESAKQAVSPLPTEPIAPSLEHLWTYRCDMTKGYNVTSIDWNKTNPVRYAVCSSPSLQTCIIHRRHQCCVQFWGLENMSSL